MSFYSIGPAGSNGQIQFNDNGGFGGDVDLTYNKTTNKLTTGGDVELNDGGSFTTTLQVVTPTAARTISFPDATGTVGLVAGSSGQLVYNNAGAYAGVPTTVIGATGDVTLALNGAASTPPLDVTGTWFTGGTATTTKPQVLIEPAGTTSTAWSTSGTGLGVNAASGFTGRLLDLQTNGTSRAVVTGAGQVGIGISTPAARIHSVVADGEFSLAARGTTKAIRFNHSSAFSGIDGVDSTLVGSYQPLQISGSDLRFGIEGNERARIDSSGRLLVGTTTASTNSPLQVNGSQRIRTYTLNVNANSSATLSISESAFNGGMQITVGGTGAGLTGNISGLWLVTGFLFQNLSGGSTITQIVNSVSANGSMTLSAVNNGLTYDLTVTNTHPSSGKFAYVSLMFTG
jgi:hypothetical protein